MGERYGEEELNICGARGVSRDGVLAEGKREFETELA